MNKVVLVGRLTKDPEIRYSQSAEPVAVTKFSLAVNRKFKKDGEPDADFINCVVFGKQAEFAEKYFKKGMMVSVSGRLQVRSWEDQSGQRRWSTDVVLDELEFAESKGSFQARNEGMGQDSGYGSKSQASQPSYEPDGFSAIAESMDDEDLPF